MDPTNSSHDAAPNAETSTSGRARYQRVVPHKTQAPITDDSYHQAAPAQTPRPTSLPMRAPAGSAYERKHMGTATSDPSYLPVNGPAHPRQSEPGHQQLHYDRYLQSPSWKKSIFTPQRHRSHAGAVIGAIAAVIVIAAIVLWFVVLR